MTEQDLRKIREMLEFLVKQKLVEKIGKLNSNEKKVYELTGKRKREEIIKETGFSAGKISSLWDKWADEGILIKEGKKYRKMF